MPRDQRGGRGDNAPVRIERVQVSHGRVIRVVSVFPANGTCSPGDKLKKLIDMDLEKLRHSA